MILMRKLHGEGVMEGRRSDILEIRSGWELGGERKEEGESI